MRSIFIFIVSLIFEVYSQPTTLQCSNQVQVLSHNDTLQGAENYILYTQNVYNSNTFGVNPKSNIIPVQTDTGIIPSTHQGYYVFNMGRTQIYGELMYGTKFGWIGLVTSHTVDPGETVKFETGGRPFYVTGLKLYNYKDSRAIVQIKKGTYGYGETRDKEAGTFDVSLNKLFRELFITGVKQVPYVGSSISGIVKTFWPEDKPNVWETIKGKVESLVDEKILDILSGILNGDIRYYQQRIKSLTEEINIDGKPRNGSSHYMHIAEDLIGFESKFSFTSETKNYRGINYVLLPLYSHLILLKVTYYGAGINNAKEIGLSSEEVEKIKKYSKDVVTTANKYITDMYQERVNNGYETFFPEDIYNTMMNVRTYIAVHGLEYIPIWNKILEDPSSESPPYNDVISYSQFFGRQTGKLNREAAVSVLEEPLTPSLLADGTRNKLKSIELFMWRIYGTGAPKIGGLRLSYENGKTYTLGTESKEINRVDLNGAYLKKLEVYGNGAMDRFVFHMSDGREIGIGTDISGGVYDVFEMEGHHIVSIFVASDIYVLGGQAANVAVSFQLNRGVVDDK